MAGTDNEVRMMMSVYPGAMTGFAALNAGLVSINNVFGAMTRSIDAQFGLINTAIITTGVVVGQLGLDAMDAFGKFEQGMKIVQMVSGQTTQEINYLKQQANDLSVSYRTDIDQLTEGLQTLGRAGLNSASEQTEVLRNGLNTAKLEGRDLNGVLEELIQNTALLGGNLKSNDFGEQSQYVNDLLVATSMTAPITTHDVSETLKYSGGIAAAAGANIESDSGKAILEDYMGAIAAFAQKGVTGSIAGTALRAFFNKPATQDSSVTEALASINLKPEYLWEDDENTMKPVSEQIAIIKNQMDDLNVSTMDQLQIWSKIVGGKMGQQMMKLDSDDIKTLTRDIRDADDATNLAQNSMKTYESNVKAIGEAGERMKRNVGEDLVTIVNPYLTVFSKLLEFANNDAMSWPITMTIIGAIAATARRIKAVISMIKTEIGTLWADFQRGLNYFTQKGGVVRRGDNPISEDKSKSEKTSSSKANEIKSISRMTLSEYDKHLSQKTQPLTISDYKKMGINDSNLAMMARMQRLTKDSLGIGISDKEFANVIGKTGVLTKEQQQQFNKLLAGTNASRGPFDTMFGKGSLNPVIAKQISENSLAVKEFEKLGVTLTDLGIIDESVTKATQQQISTAQQYANTLKALTDEKIKTGQQFVQQTNAFKESFLSSVNSMYTQAEEKATATTQINAEKEAKQIETEKTGAAEEVKINQEKQSNILSQVTLGSQEIIRAVSAAVAETKAAVTSGFGMPGYVNTTSFFGNTTGTGRDVTPLYREWIRSGLGKAFGFDLTDDKMAHYLAANRIPGYLGYSDKVQEITRNNIKAYPDIGKNSIMPVYGPASPDGEQIWRNIQRNAAIGTGPGVGNVPNIEDNIRVKEEQRKADEEKRARLVQQARNDYSERDAASTKALKEHQEKVKKENLSRVQYGEAELKAHREGVLAEQEIYMMRRQAADTALQNAHQRASSTEKDRVRFQEDRSKSNLITSRQEIDDIRRQAAADRNKAQRELSTERDRQKFQEERSKSNMVSQREAEKFRSDALKKSGYVRENQNFSKSFSNQMNNIGLVNQSLGKFANQVSSSSSLNQKTAQILDENKNVLSRIQSNPRIVGTGYSNTQDWKNYNAGYGLVGSSNFQPKGTVSTLAGGVLDSLGQRWKSDRAGRFNFGTKMVNGEIRSVTKGLRGLGNGLLNMTDLIGGPVMLAFMAIPAAIELWKGAFEGYCNELKKAQDNVSDAYSKLSSAESSLEKTFKDANPDATSEEIDDMVLESYGTLYDDLTKNHDEYWKKASQAAAVPENYEYDEEKDDGSTKVQEEEKDDETKYQESLDKNTSALYAATSQLNNALNVLETKMTDGWWGVDGWTGKITDALGKTQDSFWGGEGSTFTSNGGKFLLTASQKDENYAGYKEMSGLMLEDFKDAGDNWIKGMRTMMGDNVDFYSKILGTHTPGDNFMRRSAYFASTQLSPQENARLQTSMKNDGKTWKKLGKELAKYENKNKKSYTPGKSDSKRIQNLIKKVNSTLGKGFTDEKILQAAYLQIAQDMFAIAQNVFVPLIQQNATSAAQTVAGVGQVRDTTNGTGSNTYNTAAIASSIAALLGTIALAQSGDAARAQALIGGDVDGVGGVTDEDEKLHQLALNTNSGDEFMREAIKQSEKNSTIDWIGKTLQSTNFGPFPAIGDALSAASPYLGTDRTAADYLAKIYGMTTYQTVRGWDSQKSADEMNRLIKDAKAQGVSPLALIQTLGKNWTDPKFVSKVEGAYLNSPDDEGDGSGGGGGGGDGGSGSGDKDNTGTKKERVDLVLCNKKEIPKLNVNLFKKPPTFTVLNKNFKLRDVKINTEDKPKAIMSSIKNAFIDVQKRTDPKIIQDEEAEYDPAGATDGNALPSGSSKPKTT